MKFLTNRQRYFVFFFIFKDLIIIVVYFNIVKVNDKDILRVCKFSKTQPRPVGDGVYDTRVNLACHQPYNGEWY